MENYSTLSRDRTFRKRSYSIVLFAIISILVLYGVVFSVDNFFGGTKTKGSPGSSYATIGAGTQAWSELLSVNGHKIIKDRGSVNLPDIGSTTSSDEDTSDSNPSLSRASTTAVVLGGALPTDEAKDVMDFVEQGGRLITDNPYLLDQFFGASIQVSNEGTEKLFASNDNVDGMDDIREAAGSGYGTIFYESSNENAGLLTGKENVADSETLKSGLTQSASAAILGYGSGDVIALVDIGPVSNSLLDKKDNALFSLQIAGASDSTVVFLEGVHGYKDTSGFAGMPLSWKIAIVGLFVAFVIFGCAQGRRFGVGEEPDRNLGPRRIYFAHAVAQAMKKSSK